MTINPYDVPHKKDDHAIDSARYFFMLMPDLTPRKTEPENKPDESNMYQAIGPMIPKYDKNAVTPPVAGKSDWNIQQVDEFMGGEW